MKKAVIIIVSIFILSSCAQLTEMVNLSKCEFKLNTIENLTLVGINIQQIKGVSDLSWGDAAKVTAAALSNNFPMSFTLNIEVKNPNKSNAALNSLEWILFIDDIQMVNGNVSNRVEIPANGGTSILPININFDLKQALSGQSGKNVLNFGFNLAGVGNRPTRIMVKAKPTIMVGSIPVQYPGYITIRNEFSSN